MQRSGSASSRPRTGYGRQRTPANRMFYGEGDVERAQKSEDSSIVTYTELSSALTSPRKPSLRRNSGLVSLPSNLISLSTSNLTASRPATGSKSSITPQSFTQVTTSEDAPLSSRTESRLSETSQQSLLDTREQSATKNKRSNRPKSSYGRRSMPVARYDEPEPIERPTTARGDRPPEYQEHSPRRYSQIQSDQQQYSPQHSQADQLVLGSQEYRPAGPEQQAYTPRGTRPSQPDQQAHYPSEHHVYIPRDSAQAQQDHVEYTTIQTQPDYSTPRENQRIQSGQRIRNQSNINTSFTNSVKQNNLNNQARPKSRKGRRPQQDTVPNTEQSGQAAPNTTGSTADTTPQPAPDKQPQSEVIPQQSELVRPVTSRGRRDQTVPQQQVTLERPKTRRGHRVTADGDASLYKNLDGSVFDSSRGDSLVSGPALEDESNIVRQAPGEVDVLRLDTGEELVDEELNMNNNAGTDQADEALMLDTHHKFSSGHQALMSRRRVPITQRRFSLSSDSSCSTPQSPLHHFTPHPPPGQPTRPRSSRYRRASHNSVEDYSPRPLMSRSDTNDSLLSYKVLPAIGQQPRPIIIPSSQHDTVSELEGLHIEDSSGECTETGDVIKSCDQQFGFKKLQRQVILPPELENGESVLLGVKLPDGRRVQRLFFVHDTLQIVLNFAEVSAGLDFTGCDLVFTMPRVTFSDLTLSLETVSLPQKTVLHVELADDQ